MMAVIAKQHAFDPLAVVQFQIEFLGAVFGLVMRSDLHGPNSKMFRQHGSQRRRQIGHRFEISGPFFKKPSAHLPGAICRQSLIDEPVLQLSQALIEKMDHKFIFGDAQITGNHPKETKSEDCSFPRFPVGTQFPDAMAFDVVLMIKGLDFRVDKRRPGV